MNTEMSSAHALVTFHENPPPRGVILSNQDLSVIKEGSILAVTGVVSPSQALHQPHQIRVPRLSLLYSIFLPEDALTLIVSPQGLIWHLQAAQGLPAHSAIHVHDQN